MDTASAFRRWSSFRVQAIFAAVALAAVTASTDGRHLVSTGRVHAAEQSPESAQRPTIIQNVRVFDGAVVIPSATVVIRDGTIQSVGNGSESPANAVIVDGSGRTLMPGFIDSHTHAGNDSLVDALVMGVTTELDMFSVPAFLTWAKAQQDHGLGADMADLRGAGILATAPGGHGTQYGFPIPTISSPGEAQAFVDARIAEGSDFIKIVNESGVTFGFTRPTLDLPTMTALANAAHLRSRLAVAHATALAGARAAIEAGVDGLAHLFIDQYPDASFGSFAAAHSVFVVPTLAVLEAVSGVPGGLSLVSDPKLAPYITAANAANLQLPWRPLPATSVGYAAAVAALQQLTAAGVPILAGTDAPNPGTAHGASMHRELELLVAAGLTSVQALRAATAAPADAFGLSDRGRIASGLRADLVLVNGDPTTDILATRDIAAVWKRGVLLNREVYRLSNRIRSSAPATSQPRIFSVVEHQDHERY